MKNEHSIVDLCAQREVSLSGYYGWQKRRTAPGPRALEEQTLAGRITELHAGSRATCDSPRIQRALRTQGHRHGRNRIARIMLETVICGRQKGRQRVPTTDSNHSEPIAPNHLAAAPAATAPKKIWVTDITYIPTLERWLSLAASLRYSRPSVGWAMSARSDTALVLAALQMARGRRQPPADLLCHSDRGVQCASGDYRAALAQAGCLAAMSPKGNCYDNAAMESFWRTLKLDLIYRCYFATHAQVRTAVFDYIEAFDRRQRLHSSLNFLCPVDFELLNPQRNARFFCPFYRGKPSSAGFQTRGRSGHPERFEKSHAPESPRPLPI